MALVREFGFDLPEVSADLFQQEERIIRMGVEPVRIELLTKISGCEFGDCYSRRIETTLDGLPVSIISLPDLVRNKLQTGRLKDLDDAGHLS